MKDYFIRKKASALIIPSDLPFFDSLAADIFQEIGKPSAVALHGIPGYYTLKHYNSKTDYLLVWGQKVKRLFIEAGCPTKRILVTGHPDLSGRRPEIKRNTTENILVLSKSMPGVPNDYFPVFSDRSATLTYAHLVRKALMAVGIRRVRFRPHPSENPHWYESHLDPDFFEVVTGSLRQELLNASLVIGPSSTAFFDAVYAGTNYLIFEPLKAGKDIFGYPVASPFDGRDRSFQVAQSDSELLRLLSILPLPPQSALEQYISPVFNRNFLKQMVSA